jgi:TolA-binding protein/streptogramin lyase
VFRSALVCLVFLLAGVASAPAQETPDLQARRLLEDGRMYRSQGKLKQAFDNFTIVVSSFPGTDSVGQALLEIGRYHLDVEGDLEKARAAFEQVTKEHAHSDAAPGAYYHLGLLTLARAVGPADIEDALAQFTRVETLYPRSLWVPRALQGAAMAHRRAGRYAEAADLDRRVSLEYPASDAAAAAQFEIGQALALSGEPWQAMEEYQQVRNRFPESEWAQPALERITVLYRLFGGPKPVFSADAGFTPAAGEVLKNVKALAMAPGGMLWIASDKTKAAVMIDASAKIGGSLHAEDPKTLCLGPRGEIVFTSASAVQIGAKDIRSFVTPPDKPGAEPQPVHNMLAAAVTAGGSVIVSDEDRNRVLRFDAKGKYLGTFPANDTTSRSVTRILVDPEGGILTLDRGQRLLQTWDENGKLLRSVGPGGIKRANDVALDPFRNLYVADEDLGVLVFDPQGHLLTTITSPGLKARAVTLDASGAVLVYDGRTERLLRFR